MENNYEYINSFVPAKWEPFPSFQTSQILKKCIHKNQHIPPSFVSHPASLFPLPVVLQCRDKDNTQIFLHTYGLRKTVHLLFKCENSLAWRNSDVFNFLQELRNKLSLDIVDAKIVYKTPLQKACMGQRFFLKLYIGKYASWTKLEHYLQDHDQLLDEIHDKISTPYNSWMIRKDLFSMGKLVVSDTVLQGQERKGSCLDQHVFYKDITFDAISKLTLSRNKSNDLYDRILTDIIYVTFKQTPFRSKYTHQILFSVHFDWSKMYSSADQQFVVWSWEKVKSWFLHFVFLEISHKGLSSNILYESNDVFDSSVFKMFEKLNLGKPSNDDIQNIFVDLIVLKGQLQRQLKSFWFELNTTSSHYVERLKKKEEQHIAIAKSLSCLCFDIETDFETHIKKQETVICICSLLFNHEHEMDILEYQVFFRVSHEISNQDEINQYLRNNRGKIISTCFNDLGDRKNNTPFNFNVKEENMFVNIYTDECRMIEDFVHYVCSKNVGIIAGFNSNKFDIPFLENRLAILKKKKISSG